MGGAEAGTGGEAEDAGELESGESWEEREWGRQSCINERINLIT